MAMLQLIPGDSLLALALPNFCDDWDLTPREGEIAGLLCQGRDRGEIARQLQMKFNTVKEHIKHIYKKLQVGNRVELLLRIWVAKNPGGGGLRWISAFLSITRAGN